MQKHLKFYIDGEWVDPTTPATLDVINPATEQAFATISMGNAADVNKAVAAAKSAFTSFSNTTVEQRIDLLAAILDEYGKRYDDKAIILPNA
jgi:aldehyde dehydrogenase (NAD+)